MPIQPSSHIDMLTDVPLNSKNEHTIYFNSVPEQIKYFDKFIFKRYYPVTYNRQHQTLMVQGKADDYYSCNYIRFQNTLFGTKYFYGFVTAVIYVNENTTEIQWEMDYIQSYWFEFTFPQQFVDRCHTVTDEIGEHLIDEGLNVGEMVHTRYQEAGYGDTKVVVAIADKDRDSWKGGFNYDYMYSGLQLRQYSHQSHEIEKLLKEYGARSNALVMMYTCPSKLLPTNDGIVPNNHHRDAEAFTFPKPTFGTPIDGYIPRNAKLYTYPFYYFYVSNNNGQGLPLRYEFFKNVNNPDKIRVAIRGTFLNPVQLRLDPVEYKSPQDVYEPTSYLLLSGYPQVSWVSDYFQQWIAENGINMALQTVGNLAQIGTGVASVNVGSVASGFAGLLATMGNGYVASNHADIARGGFSSGNVNMASITNDFYFTTFTLNKEMARSIDSFFTRYGYKQNRLMNLNFTARPQYTYIKTFNAHVNGTGSDPAKRAIEQALDDGITFWRNGDNIGDYTVDNSVSHDPHPDIYTCLVQDGRGSGDYMAGVSVTIVANRPPEGYKFDHWEITYGQIPIPTNASTTFTMPAGNTVVSAIFRENPKPQPEAWNLALQLHEHLGEVEWSPWIQSAQAWMFGQFETYPWCATVVAYCAHELGILDQFGVPALGSKRDLASTTSMKNRFATLGKLHRGYGYDQSYRPKQGDVLFISWSSNPNDLDHTALCWGFSTEGVAQITYIGGNQGTGTTDGITMRTVSNTSKIICWVGEINNDGIVKP